MNVVDRNLGAEVRAVEEGHRARLDKDSTGKAFIRVSSDTHAGKSYRVDTLAVFTAGEPITFLCQPMGSRAFQDDHHVASAQPGVTACKHAALAARRLEREGLAIFDGELWRSTCKAVRAAVDLSDPFEGF